VYETGGRTDFVDHCGLQIVSRMFACVMSGSHGDL